MSRYENLAHPVLILIRGLPGSGKSYLATALRQRIGGGAVVILDPDTIDYASQAYKDHVVAQTKEGVDPELHPYRFLRAQAYQGITDHKIIIWNQPFTNLEMLEKIFDRLETHAREQSTSLPVVVVEMGITPETAKERVVTRKRAGGHGPSDTTFTRFVSEYATAAKFGYKTIAVQGDAEISESVTAVMDIVAELVRSQ